MPRIGYDRLEFRSNMEFNVVLFEMMLTIIRRLDDMAIDLTHLTAEVAEVKSVEASAVVLIQGIAQRIADAVAAAGVDPAAQAAVDGLVAQLKASSDALAAAVAANTPVTPVVETPVVEPAPVVETPPADEAPQA